MAIKKNNKAEPQWTYNGEIVDDISKTPKDSFSFIYKITLEDGRYYFGKKFMWKPKYTSGVKKGQSKGQYPWQNYKGSSKTLLEFLKIGMGYSKEILQFCYSKAETTYEESRIILCSNGLVDPNCFNFWVSCKVYAKNLQKIGEKD